MAIKEFLDRTTFSDKKSASDLYGNSIRKKLNFDVYGRKKVFDALVLSAPIFLQDADLSSGRSAEESGVMKKFAFKARILDNPSPHDYLPDPCEIETAADSIRATKLINMHTTFISSDDYTRKPGALPKVGDVVRVRLEKNIFSFNLQYGEFLNLKDNIQGGESESVSNACKSSMQLYLAGVSQIGGADVASGTAARKATGGTPTTTPVYTPGNPSDFASSIENISSELQKKMQGKSMHAGCPIGFDKLKLVTVTHKNKTGKDSTGQLVVLATLAETFVAIFKDLYTLGYQIEKMQLVHNYDGNDTKSMTANNTSAFNCRAVTGGSSYSPHSYGYAIDINPLVNPYVKGSTVSPAGGRKFKDRTVSISGTVTDDVVTIFAKHGFSWGGDWWTKDTGDYQHFWDKTRDP